MSFPMHPPLTVAYRRSRSGLSPLLDVYVVNPHGKEAKLQATPTPHLPRSVIAQDVAQAIELSPGAPLAAQLVQPDQVHNAAMNGHGDPGALWGPSIQIVPDVDPGLDQPEDWEDHDDRDSVLSEAMTLGHDFLGQMRITFDGPATMVVLAA
jgi:hypothetical protein